MSEYRIELRIFGLLIFALISTIVLAYGLDATDVQGDVLGIEFTVVGPSAAFIVLILIFFATGLFKFGLENNDDKTLSYPMEKLTIEEIESMIDELMLKSRKIERRTRQLEAAKSAAEQEAGNDAILAASGFRAVRRPGATNAPNNRN